MGLRRDLETCGRASNGEEKAKGTDTDAEARPRNTGQPEGGQETAGKAVEALLGEDPPNAKEAWWRMKGWYQAAAKRGPLPARATLERTVGGSQGHGRRCGGSAAQYRPAWRGTGDGGWRRRESGGGVSGGRPSER